MAAVCKFYGMSPESYRNLKAPVLVAFVDYMNEEIARENSANRKEHR